MFDFTEDMFSARPSNQNSTKMGPKLGHLLVCADRTFHQTGRTTKTHRFCPLGEL